MPKPPLPRSVLKDVVDELPDDFNMKAESVPNFLKKKQVKDEELEFSGTNEKLLKSGLPKVSKQDLQAMEANRDDFFGHADLGPTHSDTTVKGTDVPSLNTGIRKFRSASDTKLQLRYDPRTNRDDYVDVPARRDVISHFDTRNAKDYLWHTRADRVELNGVPTHRVQEIQSDLHQRGRQIGYSGMSAPGHTPFKENWSTKALEQELLTASETGTKALAVPLEGKGTDSLVRSKGVKEWYSTKVRSTMKKLAKKIGGEYVEYNPVRVSTRPFEILDNAEPKATIDTPEEVAALLADDASFSARLPATIGNPVLESNPLNQVLTAYNRANHSNDRTRATIPQMREWVAKLSPAKRLIEMPGLLGKQRKSKNDFIRSVQDAYDNYDGMELHQLKTQLTDAHNSLANSKVYVEPTLADIANALWEKRDDVSFWHINELNELQEKMYKPIQAPKSDPAMDVTYGQIILPEGEDWKKKLTLYTAGGAAALTGMTGTEDATAGEQEFDYKVEIQGNLDYMINEAGIPREEAIQILNDELQPEMEALIAEGYSPEEVRAEFGDMLTIPERTIMQGSVPEGGRELVDVVDPKQYSGEMQEQLLNTAAAAARNVTDEYMPFFGEIKAKYIDENGNATQQYADREKAITTSTANVLRNMGYDVSPDEKTGDLMWTRPDGTVTAIDPSMWDEIQASEAEWIGAIGGGAAALKLAGEVPFFGRWAKGIAMIAGSVVGGAGGRQLDGVKNAWFTRQHLKNEYYERRLKDSLVGGATYELLGGAVFEGARLGGKGVGWAYDLVMKGNQRGAYDIMKEHMNLDEVQIEEIINLWQKHAEAPEANAVQKFLHLDPEMDKRDLAMQAVMQTQPGGEAFVGPAGAMHSRASTALQTSIDKRAKDLIGNVRDLTNDNIGVVLYDELGKYKDTVKAYYGGIKDLGANELAESAYKFDYDKLAIKPLLKSMDETITNPAVQERFLKLSQKIRDIGAPDGPRDFKALLDLRVTVNDFKFNTKIRDAAGRDAIDQVGVNIDSEIRKAASHMEAGDIWLKEWKKANIEYGKMKELEKNVLYKTLTKKGVTPKKVINALKNNVDSIDGTFMEVVGKLPPKVRAQTEGAVLDMLLDKRTLGDAGGAQAIDFPGIAADLKHMGFSDDKARSMKRVINEMADVYKNDVHLSRATGNVASPKFQSYLTTDPVVRAKYEMASSMFNWIRKLAPTNQGKSIALISRLGKILETPRDAKLVDQLLKDLPDDPKMKESLRQLAIQSAKFGEKESYPRVEVFRTGVPGSMHQARDGKLGKGIYWSTDKAAAKSRATDTGAKLASEKVLPGRIAGEDDLIEISGTEDFEALLKDPEFVKTLKDRGFYGVTTGSDVLIFK
jgi:hypothetical protein